MKTPGHWTIEGFFAGRPEADRLFLSLKNYIESIGPVKIEAMKTQISFGVRTKFAWVWLPQTWIKKRPDNSITLTFSTDRRIKHDRIETAVEPRPGRWTHHVVIEKESDIDEDVKAWLREAYALAQYRKVPNRESKPPGDRVVMSAKRKER